MYIYIYKSKHVTLYVVIIRYDLLFPYCGSEHRDTHHHDSLSCSNHMIVCPMWLTLCNMSGTVPCIVDR